MKSLPLVMLLIGAGAFSVAQAGEPAYPRAGLLMEPKELSRPEVSVKCVILDVRSSEAFAEGHIPNARQVDPEVWAKTFADGSDADGWSQRIGTLGIGADLKVVVYDDKALKDAARIWWILRYWGVRDVTILNGGWKAWQAEGRPTSTEAAGVTSVEFAAQSRPQRLATKTQILELLPQNGAQIVDARSKEEFCGTNPLKNQRAGAIPGAKHLDWSELVDQETHRFKDAATLRDVLEKAGIDPHKPTVTHCQSGGRSSVMAFGLELMGAEDIRNYYQGWGEWGNSKDTPIEPGKVDKAR